MLVHDIEDILALIFKKCHKFSEKVVNFINIATIVAGVGLWKANRTVDH